jgi:predicted DsbA family dithiol-disulfide isomerase
MTALTIDIVSDLVCPWCFIGKRHLETALASMGETAPQVSIRWHPFQLNPDLPLAGVSRKSYIETKFGGPQRAAEIYARVKNAGAATGLDLQFDKIVQQPNTLAGHALVALAQEEGVADAVVEALFKAYFEDGVFIGDVKTLADIGAAHGLAGEKIVAVLNDPQTLQTVAAQDASARAQGISGVPFFVIGNQFSLSGAQPPEALRQAIEQAVSRAS